MPLSKKGIKSEKKTIAFDINPLSVFLLSVYTASFDFSAFKKEAEKNLDSKF